MNKEQQELLDDVYENYSKEYEKDNSIGMCLLIARMDGKSTYRKPNKEMFIDLCTHDKTFSEKWGLQIEERELSWEERIILAGYDYENRGGIGWNMLKESVDLDNSIPRKLITITYNDKTIESFK
jgi:hypothetical protein